MSVIVANAWQKYLQALASNPVQTKQITSVIIGSTSDLIAQKVFEKRQNIDYARLARFAFFGFILTPISHKWYTWLDNSLFKDQSGFGITLAKLLLDQLFFDPLVYVLFFSYMDIATGAPDRIPHDLREKLFPTILKSWRVWPLAQLISFSFVPSHLRVLFNNIVGLFWGVFMSIINKKK